MNLFLLWSTVVLLSSPLLISCDPLYVLSAPNLLRVGSSENVFVEAQDYNGRDIEVKIMVKNFPTKQDEFLSKTLTLTRNKNFQSLFEINIPANEKYFNGDVEKQYVFLQAQFPSKLLEKVVMVSFQSGYIFVQTDKPIYTPASTVKYRLFSLTPNLHLSKSGITVEIKNPQGISLHKETVTPVKGMTHNVYPIHEFASPGIWKLVTWNANTPQKTFTTEFEVKEYVLPTIETTLSLSKSYFYVGDQEITVDINAKYLFGRKVEGHAFVVFGIIESNDKQSIPSSLQRVQLLKGKGRATLTRNQIMQTFPNIDQLVGLSIYVSVTVLTESGSEMVETQKRGIHIVRSPYTIHFKRTPQFFKPGMPFDVSVYVTNPDQTPAENVQVEVNPGGLIGQTKSNGIAKVITNGLGHSSMQDITVKTKDSKLEDSQQAEKRMRVHSYTPKGNSKNSLHISIDAAELKIGEERYVNFNMPKGSTVKNHDFTYMIISKGQIISVGRLKRQEQSLLSLHLTVTKDMLPSFRFVAYYHVGSDEVVSDSVWVDVKDDCMGTLKLELRDEDYDAGYRSPHDNVKLQITGDPGAKVGLVVVDKAVHVLNKNRLTQTKIWDVIEKHDPGCTAGSGKDSMGVFYDAGLMFKSNTAGGTKTRTTHDCPVLVKRRRSSEDLWRVITTLSGKYSGDLKKCCVDGMRETKLGYTCERRARYIDERQECVKAFLHCCNEATESRYLYGEGEMILARNDVVDDYSIDSDDIVSRSVFPETWLWNDVLVPHCAGKTCVAPEKGLILPDPITTWQILAISVSDTHGICVADPLEIVVFKKFFIDLKVPYSVVRNEQLEIRAIIHNYTPNKMKSVRVDFLETPHVCSAASKKGKYRTIVEVDAFSTRAVSFVIIPMKLSGVEDTFSIEVKASALDFTDGVKKTLKVVSEGVLRNDSVKNVELNPEKMGGVQVERLKLKKPADWIPGTPSTVFISVSGDDITQTVEKVISGDFMGKLINQPGGCGEQNIMHMSLSLIATHYLDKTNQWDTVGMEQRTKAIQYINTGYQTQMSYRKDDGSYAAFPHSRSGTWLTAYVAKIFAMAEKYNAVQTDVLCSALKWLVLHKQLPDGSFKEDQPIFTISMGGDVQGKDGETSLTAFVLIAMQEGSEICARSVGSIVNSMIKAVGYLESKLQKLTNPYAVALTSCALANANKLNKDVLMRHSTKQKDGIAWIVSEQHYHSLEATAYAVLALLKANDYVKAGEAVHWLARQQSNYGGYRTTQATIMVFQAVAEYHTKASKKEDFRLDVELKVAERSGSVRWSFGKYNARDTRSNKLDLDSDFDITAKGNGTATLSVVRLYYAKPADNVNNCNKFDLNVKIEQDLEESYVGALESYTVTLDFFYKSKTDATMSILDVGLLTGFVVDERDLTELVTSTDRVIQKFEINKKLSERGSLIIYLKKVSHENIEKVVFRMHKINNVDWLQPAGVTVYAYYSPDERCTKYYHPERQDGGLRRLCQGEICQCAEEKCSYQRKNQVTETNRWEKACEAGMDYVYRVKVERVELANHIDIYKMKVLNVTKRGTDPVMEGDERIFMSLPNCRVALELQQDKTYLIMGKFIDIPLIEDEHQYVLGEHTWIEYWPTREESQSTEYRQKYIELSQLSYKLSRKGCDS